MEKIKISKKMKLNDVAGKLLPYFIYFFGSKYQKTIINTFNHSVVYEWNKETKDKLTEVMGNYYKLQNNVDGFMQKQNTATEEYNLVVINGKTSKEEKMFSLIHELVHCVFSEINKYAVINDELYERNGIALFNHTNKKNSCNKLANEGIVEFITCEIIKLCFPNIDVRRYCSAYYDTSRLFAEVLFQTFGKEKLLDILVLNEGNINTLYNPDDLNEFNQVSKELDKEEPFLGIYIHKLKERNKNKERNDINERMCVR